MGLLRKKRLWLGMAVAVTILFAVFYIAVQQALRYSADEPQASMVGDVAVKLDDGRRPDSLVNGRIDMATDMAPFIIIYDKFGKVVKGNGYVDGSVPQVPIGVLAASDTGVNKVTWQPSGDVRIAAVAMKEGDNYVLGGRNLEVIEHNINTFTRWLGVSWLICVTALVFFYRATNRKPKHTAKETVKHS